MKTETQLIEAMEKIAKTWTEERVDKITDLEEAKNQLLFMSIFASKVIKEIKTKIL